MSSQTDSVKESLELCRRVETLAMESANLFTAAKAQELAVTVGAYRYYFKRLPEPAPL
jgi:hypothetical protein